MSLVNSQIRGKISTYKGKPPNLKPIRQDKNNGDPGKKTFRRIQCFEKEIDGP